MLFIIVFVISFMASWIVCGAPRPSLRRGPDKVAIAQADERRALHQKLNEEASAVNDVEACSVFEIRMTQQKMVDAGIIKPHEMSVCDNENCRNCYKATFVGKPTPKYQAPVRPKRRRRQVRNEWVDVPKGVPDYAYPKLHPLMGNPNYFEIYWTWTDDMTGKPMTMRSLHPKEDAFDFQVKSYKEELNGLKSLEKKITDTKKELERYTNKNCDCCYDVIEVDQRLDAVRMVKTSTCEPCKSKALTGALKRSKVRRSTGDMGPG